MPAAGVQGSKRNDKLLQNVLATILQCNHCYLANLPIALKLFDMKWKRFGRTMIMADVSVHVMSVLVQMLPGRHFVGWIGGDEAQVEDPVGSPAQVVKWPAMMIRSIYRLWLGSCTNFVCKTKADGLLSREPSPTHPLL
jgi:hypothetical protein